MRFHLAADNPKYRKGGNRLAFFEKGEPRLCVSRFKQRAAQRIRLPVIRCGRRLPLAKYACMKPCARRCR